MTGSFGAMRRGSAAISAGPLLGVPAAEQRRLHFAAVRPLEQGDGALLVGGADDAPAGARGDGRDQPALVGVGVEQQ